MKTITLDTVIVALVLLLLQGCMSGGISVDTPEQIKMSFAADGIIDDEPCTKTALDGTRFLWSAQDTVGVYPGTGAQVFFSLASGAECSSASFDGGGWDFKESATYYSYYPFIGDIYLDRTRIPVSFLGQEQNGVDNFDHFGFYDFMYADAATKENGRIHFSYHHFSCILRVMATLPAGTYTQLTVKAPEPVFVENGYYDLTSAAPAIIPVKSSDTLALDLKNLHLTGSSNSCEMYVVSAPFDLAGKEIVLTLTDNTGDKIQCAYRISKAYVSGTRYKLTCPSWTRIPTNGNAPIRDWINGETVTIQ